MIYKENKIFRKMFIFADLVSLTYCLTWFFNSLGPINYLSVIKGQVFLGWTITKLGLMFLLKDTTQWSRWGLNPWALNLESSTLPLRSLTLTYAADPKSRQHFHYTPRKLCLCWGILFSLCPCVCACVRPSVTFCFFNNLESHCWIFIKPCKHVHICKTNNLDKKVRARGQFY